MPIDTFHEMKDVYSQIIAVCKQADSVDYALTGLLPRDDIAVTQDYGFAAMVLGKGAGAVNQNGLIFTDENIDKLPPERHIGQKRYDGAASEPKARQSAPKMMMPGLKPCLKSYLRRWKSEYF